MTQNESIIEQINLGFNDQEDRLLLRLGLADKTEIAVWITRRICKAMWGLLQGEKSGLTLAAPQLTAPTIVMPANKDQAIKSFVLEAAEQKTIKNMDFNSEYIAGRQTRSEEPMLAVQCAIISTENLPPNLELQCQNGQAVKMALTKELIHATTNMMQLATREAGWDLQMTADNVQTGVTSAQQVLH